MSDSSSSTDVSRRRKAHLTKRVGAYLVGRTIGEVRCFAFLFLLMFGFVYMTTPHDCTKVDYAGTSHSEETMTPCS